MKWSEAAVLISVAMGATLASILAGFDPVAVFTGVLGWGASRTMTRQ